MKLYIKQRVISFLDSYDVYADNFNKKYTVKAEMQDFFKLGAHLHVYDLFGKEKGVIRQKPFQFLPTYEIEVDGQKLGEIKKQFNLLKKNFDVNYLGLARPSTSGMPTAKATTSAVHAGMPAGWCASALCG